MSHRTSPELPLAAGRLKDVHARDVGRKQIGGALNTAERHTEHDAQRAGKNGLANAGPIFEQQVALTEQRCEHEIEMISLACNDLFELMNEPWRQLKNLIHTHFFGRRWCILTAHPS